MTYLTLEGLQKLEHARTRSIDARNDLLLSTDEVLHWRNEYQCALEDAAPALLAMARELVRIRGAWHHLEDVNKLKRGSLLRRAIELGWVDPLPPSERKGEAGVGTCLECGGTGCMFCGSAQGAG